MITYKEFEVINTLLKAKSSVTNVSEYVYTNVYYYVFKSQDETATLVKSLEEKGYIAGGAVTKLGLKEIEALRVKNAVILAAGGADISALLILEGTTADKSREFGKKYRFRSEKP